MWISFFRTTILYLVLITAVRIMGKRQVGELEPSEFVVTMLAANLASVPMEERDIPLSAGLIPIGVILALELGLSWGILKSRRLRRLVCGRPVLLIDNGRLCQDNLRKCRITLPELLSHLRQKDVLDLGQVQYAILETDGNLSVFPYPQKGSQSLPISFVEDGRVNRENLRQAGKDRAWLQKALARQGAEQKDTFLLALDSQGKTVFVRKE